jgi:hypothetical protein
MKPQRPRQITADQLIAHSRMYPPTYQHPPTTLRKCYLCARIVRQDETRRVHIADQGRIHGVDVCDLETASPECLRWQATMTTEGTT